MRRRQLFAQRSNAPVTTAAGTSLTDDAPFKSPATSRAVGTAPGADLALQPLPVADDAAFEIAPRGETLRYRGKGGKIVTLCAAPSGLELWNGAQWVPAHVVPSKRGGDGQH
jgi:hypothetical protein